MKVVHTLFGLLLFAKLRTILAYGLDFNLLFYKFDFYRYFLPFERLALWLSREDHVPNTSDFLPRLHTLNKKYFYRFKPYKIFSLIIQREAMVELTNLSRNKDVVVCKPENHLYIFSLLFFWLNVLSAVSHCIPKGRHNSCTKCSPELKCAVFICLSCST